MILTATPNVAIHYGTAQARPLGRVTASALRAFRAEGHFPAGSMGPKVDAALDFLEGGGKRVVIAHLDDAMAALRGDAGTQILPDDAD